MGFRFRKSIKSGPFRLNFSKSGIGYSVGAKGFRYTKKAGGGARTTASIPGTGISHVKESGRKSGSPSRQAAASVIQNNGQERNKMERPRSSRTELMLCLCLGWAGAHRFYRKQYKMGILYLLTVGLFFVGWWGDLIQMAIARSGKQSSQPLSRGKKIGSYVAAFLCTAILASCNSGSNPPAAPVEPPLGTASTTEATVQTTVATVATETVVTEESTEPPETTTAETTVPPTTVPEITVPETTVATALPTEMEPVGTTYILNTNTMKFHYESCSSVKDIKPGNKSEFVGSREDVIARGYDPCGRCHP